MKASSQHRCPACGQHMRVVVDALAAIECIPFGPQSSRLFRLLARNLNRYMAVRAIVDAVYFDDPNGGPACANNNIRVMICTHRHKLTALGLRIESQNGSGSGYRMVIAPDGGAA